MNDTTKEDGIITLMDDTVTPEIVAAAKEARRQMRLANMCMALMFPSEDDVDFYAKGPMPNLQRVLADLGCLHRVGRDENGNLQSDFPMLIRGILHPCEPMPLDVVANGRLVMIDRLPCRAVFLTKPLLWVPGTVLSVRPMAAIVMGQPLTPRDALQHYVTGKGNLLCASLEPSSAPRSAPKTWSEWASAPHVAFPLLGSPLQAEMVGPTGPAGRPGRVGSTGPTGPSDSR